MKSAEISSWDGKTIQDVAISVGTPDVKVDDAQDIVDEEIDLECEDWFGSIENADEESPLAHSRRPAA